MPKRPDENRFTIPTTWRTHIHPFRGSVTASRVRVDDTAVTALRERADEFRLALERTTGAPDLLDAARAWLRGEASPLGAAVVTKLARRLAARRGAAKFDPPAFADLWVAAHGIAFAAEAAVDLAQIEVDENGTAGYVVARADPEDWDEALSYGGLAPVVHRVRALLAAADDTDYQAAATVLAGRREHDVERVIGAYLVPTETAWVDEALATAEPDEDDTERMRLVLCSVRSVEQLHRVSHHERALWSLTFRDTMYTVAERVGPAIAPLLAAQWPRERRDANKKCVLAVLAALPTDEAFELLVACLDQPHVNAAVRDAATRYPARALRVLASAASGSTSVAPLAARLLHEHAAAHPDLVAALPPETRAALDGAEQPADRVAEAALDELPALLVNPPWAAKRTVVRRPVVKGLEPSVEPAVVWAKGERRKWADTRVDHYRGDIPEDAADPYWARYRDLADGTHQHELPRNLFLFGPEDVARPLLRTWQPPQGNSYAWMRVIVARFELDALPAALALARPRPAERGELLHPFATVEVAELMADWLRLKALRSVAEPWFHRHAAVAARALVPAAVGRAGKPRGNAEGALRFIATTPNGVDTIIAAARHYGDAALAAIQSLLDRVSSAEERVTAPKPPAWLDVHRLPQVLLRDRERALPLSAVEHLTTLLNLSTWDSPFPGLDAVVDSCDRASLTGFAWALFDQSAREFRFHGYRGDWVLPALGRFGDDDTVRRLAPVIRAWHKKDNRKAAVAGLDVLAAIGTDAALVQLNSIAQSPATRSLGYEAQRRLNTLARVRGLRPDQLADQLVPDFGLDERGSLTLDYGPRRFTVGFDDQLKPFVTDQTGKRLKDLPKPGARDDADLAPAAHARFAELKKDVRTVAANQIRRLEQAMISQRRWELAEFQRLFVHHPLLWHIARRLLWRADTGVVFRVCEDRTFADADDTTTVLPETTRVSVAHPVHLGEEAAAWAEVFADYEILQPFPQLHRPVHRLTGEERTSAELTRFHGTTVPTTRVLGLQRRGWSLVSHGGGVDTYLCRPARGNRKVVIVLDPGVERGAPLSDPEQRVVRVALTDAQRGAVNGRFGELDAVLVSEVLTDLTTLTAPEA